MRLNHTSFLRKAQHPLLMGLATLPVTMLMALSTDAASFPWCWCLPAAYVLAAWVCLLIPGRRRLLAAAAASAGMAALSVTLLPWRAYLFLLLLPAAYIALLFRTLPIGGWPYTRELAVGWHVSGALTHILLQILVNISHMTGNSMFAPAQTPLLISFLAYAVLVLLALNRASLDSAAQSRRTVPLLMRRQNIVITLVLFVIGIMVAAIPAIGSALGVAWDYILQVIVLLISFLASLMPQQREGTGAPAAVEASEAGFGKSNPPSAFALLMEKVITVIALIVIVVALILLLYAAGQKLWKLLKRLWARMIQYSAAASEDYEDEITSTRDESDTEREGLLARLRRAASIEEKGQTPTERIRLRYRHLRRTHSDWGAATTARETLPEEAAALYERARYAGHVLTEAEADRFKDSTRRV